MQVEHAPTQPQFLDRLIKGLVLSLALAVIGFAVFYYVDRRADPGPKLVDRAIAQAESAVRAEPKNPGFRILLADLYLDGGRLAEAQSQYELAIQIDQIDDTLWQTHRGLGLVYLAQNRNELAETELQKVVDAKKDAEFAAVDRDLAEAYFYLAQARQKLRGPEAAIPDLEAALAIDRLDADALLLLGTTYVAAGRPADALPPLRRAAAFVPKFPETYQALERAYRALGDQSGVTYSQAMLLYSNGHYDQSIEKLKALTETKPDFLEAWNGLGYAYEAKQQKREAAQAYYKVVQANPNDYNAVAGLARLGIAP